MPLDLPYPLTSVDAGPSCAEFFRPTAPPASPEGGTPVKDQLKEAIIAGDAGVTQAWADEVGADGYGANAGLAVERAKGLVG